MSYEHQNSINHYEQYRARLQVRSARLSRAIEEGRTHTVTSDYSPPPPVTGPRPPLADPMHGEVFAYNAEIGQMISLNMKVIFNKAGE